MAVHPTKTSNYPQKEAAGDCRCSRIGTLCRYGPACGAEKAGKELMLGQWVSIDVCPVACPICHVRRILSIFKGIGAPIIHDVVRYTLCVSLCVPNISPHSSISCRRQIGNVLELPGSMDGPMATCDLAM